MCYINKNFALLGSVKHQKLRKQGRSQGDHFSHQNDVNSVYNLDGYEVSIIIQHLKSSSLFNTKINNDLLINTTGV